MAYEIRIAGEKEPMIVDNHIGLSLKEQWMDYKKSKQDKVVDIQNWTGTLSSIKGFKSAQSDRADSTAIHDIHSEYRNERDTFISKSLEDKAKRMSFFRLFYFVMTQKKSEEVFLPNGKCIEELAQKIQYNFFKDNKKLMICSPYLFKPIIKSNTGNTHGLHVIERMVETDKWYNQNLKGEMLVKKSKEITSRDVDF